MLLKNKNYVIADYEIGIDWDCILQMELYGDAFQSIYSFFSDNSLNCGEKLKPGVIREDIDKYNKFEQETKTILLRDKEYIQNLIAKGYRNLFTYNKKIHYINAIPVDRVTYHDFLELYNMMKLTLSMMAFNWIMPNEEQKNILREALGKEEGNSIYFSMGVPDAFPHFKLLQLGINKLAMDRLEGRILGFEQFKDYFGCLQNFGFKDSLLEQDEQIEAKITEILTNSQNKKEYILDKTMKIKAMHQRALTRKSKAYQTVFGRYKLKSNDKLDEILAICRLIEFVNDEEELRHTYQMRAQRIVKKLLQYYQLPLEDATFQDIILLLKGRETRG